MSLVRCQQIEDIIANFVPFRNFKEAEEPVHDDHDLRDGWKKKTRQHAALHREAWEIEPSGQG